MIIGDEYLATMDIVPQQDPESTRIHQFFAALKNEGVLTTTKCRECGHVSWPPRIMCPVCTSGDLAWIRLPGEGVVKVWSGGEAVLLRGYSVPNVLGIVELDGEPPVRVFTRIVGAGEDEITEDMRVKLKVLGASRGRVVFAFAPV